ncbi:hypothetical protein MAR_017077, partial [Mya arenaria]
MLIGKDEEPYGVQTLLGWSVIGYVNPSLEAVSMPGVCHRTLVQIKELPPCQPRDVIKVLERDFDQDGDKDKKVSQEDIYFLNLLDSTIHQRDDKHLEMPLPFKKRPVMPNNKQLAVLRLNHLKRKLQNDQKYYGHYRHTETEEEAIQLIKDAQELCANGCMHLHKFISNRKRVIDLIPVSETAADVKDLDLALDQLPVERALGASGIPDVLERLDRFSTYSKLLSVMARLQRLSNGVKRTHAPTVEERRMAEITILKLVQEWSR